MLDPGAGGPAAIKRFDQTSVVTSRCWAPVCTTRGWSSPGETVHLLGRDNTRILRPTASVVAPHDVEMAWSGELLGARG
jgi:hypothetical protein